MSAVTETQCTLVGTSMPPTNAAYIKLVHPTDSAIYIITHCTYTTLPYEQYVKQFGKTVKSKTKYTESDMIPCLTFSCPPVTVFSATPSKLQIHISMDGMQSWINTSVSVKCDKPPVIPVLTTSKTGSAGKAKVKAQA